MIAAAPVASLDQPPPSLRGLPFLGNVVQLARDPARFFFNAHRELGPVYRISILGMQSTVLAGVEACLFMQSQAGRELLRTREYMSDLSDEFRADKAFGGVDGHVHDQLRDVLRPGMTAEALRGRYDILVDIADKFLERDWRPSELVPAVNSFQEIVTNQLAVISLGMAPGEDLEAVRTMTDYLATVCITRQRPKFWLWSPRYQRARARVFKFGNRMIADYKAAVRAGTRKDVPRNTVDYVMEAHRDNPTLVTERDLIVNLTAPLLAGFHTVPNILATCVYEVLKHPEILTRIQREVDAFFAKGSYTPADLKALKSVQGALMETMRLYPAAVALPRTANRAFDYEGYRIKEGEPIFIATTTPHFMAEHFPDPDVFDIDRYQAPRSEHLKPGVYSPFGRGPHTCLGKSLADLQMLLTTARIFHKLDLSLHPSDYVLKFRSSPLPGPSFAFKVKVRGLRN